MDIREVVVEQNLDRRQVAYRFGRQMGRCRQGSQTVGSIVGGGTSGGIKAAAFELLSLDGFRVPVGRSPPATWTIECARDIERSA